MKAMPTVKQLRYLVELEKQLHFGKAAEACFVTQSAFSIAIKELESLLNVSLVDRSNRSVVFTPTGKAVARQARAALMDIEGILDITRLQQEPLSGELKMGVIPTIAPFLLPRLLPRLRKCFPKLELYLKEDQTGRIHTLLLAGDLDVLLLALPVDLPGTESVSIFNDPFKLAFHKHTRLIDPDNFSPDRFNQESILLLEDGHCLRDHALSACGIARKSKISKFSASGLHSLIQMVDSDLGVTFVPQMAIDSGLLKHTRIHTRELKDNAYREIGLAWRKSSVRSGEFTLLADTIRNSIN